MHVDFVKAAKRIRRQVREQILAPHLARKVRLAQIIDNDRAAAIYRRITAKRNAMHVEGYVDTDTPADRWRVGTIFRKCWDGKLLQESYQLSIRPGETGRQAYERENEGKPMPEGTAVLERDM